MSKPKNTTPPTCRICGREIFSGEPHEWVKHKGVTYYVHANCLKKEGATKR